MSIFHSLAIPRAGTANEGQKKCKLTETLVGDADDGVDVCSAFVASGFPAVTAAAADETTSSTACRSSTSSHRRELGSRIRETSCEPKRERRRFFFLEEEKEEEEKMPDFSERQNSNVLSFDVDVDVDVKSRRAAIEAKQTRATPWLPTPPSSSSTPSTSALSRPSRSSSRSNSSSFQERGGRRCAREQEEAMLCRRASMVQDSGALASDLILRAPRPQRQQQQQRQRQRRQLPPPHLPLLQSRPPSSAWRPAPPFAWPSRHWMPSRV